MAGAAKALEIVRIKRGPAQPEPAAADGLRLSPFSRIMAPRCAGGCTLKPSATRSAPDAAGRCRTAPGRGVPGPPVTGFPARRPRSMPCPRPGLFPPPGDRWEAPRDGHTGDPTPGQSEALRFRPRSAGSGGRKDRNRAFKRVIPVASAAAEGDIPPATGPRILPPRPGVNPDGLPRPFRPSGCPAMRVSSPAHAFYGGKFEKPRGAPAAENRPGPSTASAFRTPANPSRPRAPERGLARNRPQHPGTAPVVALPSTSQRRAHPEPFAVIGSWAAHPAEGFPAQPPGGSAVAGPFVMPQDIPEIPGAAPRHRDRDGALSRPHLKVAGRGRPAGRHRLSSMRGRPA